MKIVSYRNFHSCLNESVFLVRARSETSGHVGNHWQDCFGHLVVGTLKVPERQPSFLIHVYTGRFSFFRHTYLSAEWKTLGMKPLVLGNNQIFSLSWSVFWVIGIFVKPKPIESNKKNIGFGWNRPVLVQVLTYWHIIRCPRIPLQFAADLLWKRLFDTAREAVWWLWIAAPEESL